MSRRRLPGTRPARICYIGHDDSNRSGTTPENEPKTKEIIMGRRKKMDKAKREALVAKNAAKRKFRHDKRVLRREQKAAARELRHAKLGDARQKDED